MTVLVPGQLSGACEEGQEEEREEVVTHDVGTVLHLKPILGEAIRQAHHTCVVEQNVESVGRRLQLLSSTLDAGQVGQVELQPLDALSGRCVLRTDALNRLSGLVA